VSLSVLCDSKDSSGTARSALIFGRVLVLAVFLRELGLLRVGNRAFLSKKFKLRNGHVVMHLSFHETIEVHLIARNAEVQRTGNGRASARECEKRLPGAGLKRDGRIRLQLCRKTLHTLRSAIDFSPNR